MNRFSVKTLQPLHHVIVCLSSLINDSTVKGQQDDRFIQDVARIRHFIDIIRDETAMLFLQLDNLISVLSVNIYDTQRQVLINENVRETMEWQDVLVHMKLIAHYMDELIRIFQRVSFYILDEFSDWVRDLIIQLKLQKKNINSFLNVDLKNVVYIEAPIKHSQANCSLLITPIYHHDFFKNVFQATPSLIIHQPINKALGLNYMDRLIGLPINKNLKLSMTLDNVEFISSNFNEVETMIKTRLEKHNIYLFFNHKSQLRVWRKKLHSLKSVQRTQPLNQIEFSTMDRMGRMGYRPDSLIIFPEFKVPNVLQPIHQQRLYFFDGNETDYSHQVFIEYIYSCLSNAFHLDKVPIIFNFDQDVNREFFPMT